MSEQRRPTAQARPRPELYVTSTGATWHVRGRACPTREQADDELAVLLDVPGRERAPDPSRAKVIDECRALVSRATSVSAAFEALTVLFVQARMKDTDCAGEEPKR